MTLQQFIDKWNGKYCEVVDPTNPNQCFDLAIACTDVLGIPRVFPFMYASQIYTNFGAQQAQYFDRIANTPDAVPKAGDIIVWDGSVGHVAIATDKADLNGLTSFDQNWPLDSVCHYQNHNYDNPPILGWLRPKKGFEQPTDDCPTKLTTITAERDKLNGVITGKDTTIQNLNTQIATLNSQLTTLQTTIRNQEATLLNDQSTIASLTETAKLVPDLQQEVKDLTDSRAGYIKDLSACKTQVGKIRASLIPKKYLSLKLYNFIMSLE